LIWSHDFCPWFYLCVYYVYWFAYVESFLSTGNETSLIMMYDLFYCGITLNLEIFYWGFCVCVHQWIGL
jgi:hypothetical protein